MTELHPKRKLKIRILKSKIAKVKDRKKKRALKKALKMQYQPSENTKPELSTKYLLDIMNIKYVQQFPLDGFIYDFILPDHRILIEVNGDFYHSSPLKYKKSAHSYMQKKNFKRDKRKMVVALSHGYRIIYIWEGDLKNKARKVKSRLEKYIANIQNEKKSFHILEELFPQYREFYFKQEKNTTKTVSSDEKTVINEDEKTLDER